MEDKMDVIVVGAGVAGSAAAYKMAKAGLSVLLVDRAKPIGSKNLSGGVLWGHDLGEVMPDWWKEGLEAGAIERPITTKGINMLTKDAGFQAQFNTNAWRKEPYNGFSVLRARFDQWLANKVMEAGGMVVDGVMVDKLAVDDNGKVFGVEQGGDVIKSDCVVLADGCNSRLSITHGLRGKLNRQTYVLGVKEVIKLDQKVLEDRFNIGPNEGVAQEYALGYLENGAKAGGFLYTNRDTISLGVVINLDSIWQKGVYTHRIMEEFRLHPSIAPLLKGGELVEYGAHLIPEGGMHNVPQLYGNGWVIAGDAAGFVYSNGTVIHGMNYAIRSGLIAADAVIGAKKAGDYGAAQLSSYKKGLENSYILKDFEKFEHTHEFVWDDNLHSTIPKLISGVFTDMYTADMQPKKGAEKIVMQNLKGVNKWSLAKTMIKGRKSV